MVTTVRDSRLAVAGGPPVRDPKANPWPKWPVGTQDDVDAVAEVILGGKWTRWTGDRVVALERALQEFTGARRAVAVASGTAAIEIALKAVGVRPGDEVIVPAYSFVASATAVLQVGAVPVFADVQLETHNLDPDSAASLVTERTRAILPVHMAGLPCDMERIIAIARRHGLKVVEDAAQAIGGVWKDRAGGQGAGSTKKVGTIGDAGCISFQASKNVSCAEGGAVITNDDVVADKAFSRMHIGRKPGGEFYTHYVLGWNYRLTELQAALLLSQLERFPELQARRRANAAYLRNALAEIPGIAPTVEYDFVAEHGLHGYKARFLSDEFAPGLGISRDTFLKALRAEGIPCGAGYEHPLYKNPLFLEAHEAMKDDCPFACAHPAALAADYSKVHLPNVERLCADETLSFPQPILLGAEQDMRDLVAAVAKLQTNAAQLAQSAR